MATAEFAESGLSGARVDEIAAKTSTTKRMIYYYFGGKDGLYIAVLEGVYGAIRRAEQELDLSSLDPEQALRRLVEFGFDYHRTHPELARLVTIENIHHAQHLNRSTVQQTQNLPIIKLMDEVLDRGRRAGLVKRSASAIETHLLLMSWAMFQVTSRASVHASFAYDMSAPQTVDRHRRMAVDVVLAWLSTPD